MPEEDADSIQQQIEDGYKTVMIKMGALPIADEIQRMILNKVPASELRQRAREEGMRTLRESGLLAIFDGLTTVEEVVAQTIEEQMVESPPASSPAPPWPVRAAGS